MECVPLYEYKIPFETQTSVDRIFPITTMLPSFTFLTIIPGKWMRYESIMIYPEKKKITSPKAGLSLANSVLTLTNNLCDKSCTLIILRDYLTTFRKQSCN